MSSRKSKLKLFQEVKLGKKKSEATILFFLCAGVFGISAFASGKALIDYDQKKKKAEIYAIGNVLAAEKEDEEENILPESSGRALASAAKTADSVKNLAIKAAKAKKAAQERAAQAALLRNAPVPRAPTKRVNGKRVCEKKNDKSHDSKKTGKPHMDMECCPDPDEWPNPHCYYTPEQLSRMLKPPK